MSIKSAKSIHPSNHGFPIDRFFGGAKADRANLVAVSTVHFEIHLVPGMVELEHAEGTACWPLGFQFFTHRRSHRNGEMVVGLHTAEPLISEAHQSGSDAVIRRP